MLKRMPVSRMACAASIACLPLARAATPRAATLSTVASKMSELEELKFLVGDRSVGSLYDFDAVTNDGDTVPMTKYEGKAVLIVNVASL